MKKQFRLFLLFVLMLAVTMQAALAVSRTCCLAQHRQNSGSHQHAQHAHHAVESAHEATSDHDASGEECCIAAAILNTLLPIALSRPNSEKIDLIFSSCVGHIGDCPEKPPKF